MSEQIRTEVCPRCGERSLTRSLHDICPRCELGKDESATEAAVCSIDETGGLSDTRALLARAEMAEDAATRLAEALRFLIATFVSVAPQDGNYWAVANAREVLAAWDAASATEVRHD